MFLIIHANLGNPETIQNVDTTTRYVATFECPKLGDGLSGTNTDSSVVAVGFVAERGETSGAGFLGRAEIDDRRGSDR